MSVTRRERLVFVGHLPSIVPLSQANREPEALLLVLREVVNGAAPLTTSKDAPLRCHSKKGGQVSR